jgi:hypothetical protein
VSQFDLKIHLANLCQQPTDFFRGHGSTGCSVPHSFGNGGEGLLVFIADEGIGILQIELLSASPFISSS